MDGTPIQSDDKPLHGRAKELKSVGGVLDAVNARREALLSLEGPAGIGKSRLLAAAEASALRQGFRVARVPTPDQRLARSAFGDRADIGPDRELVAPDGVAAWVEAAADLTSKTDEPPRSILTIDDTEWADAAAVDTLASLQSRLAGQPIGWIVSGRTAPQGPGVDDLLGGWEAMGADRVNVEPLSDDAVNDLIGDVLGAPPDEALRQLAEGTAGNPQLLRALLDGLRDEKSIAVSGGRARLLCSDLPVRARAVMHYWVLELPALSRHLLDAAAAFDGPFSREELADLLERPADQLESLLRELVEADLIVELDDDVLVFRHEMVRRWASDRAPVDARCGLRDGSARRHPRKGAGSSARHAVGRAVGRNTGKAGRTEPSDRDHARSAGRDGAWDRLTDCERDVATLVALGLTNREVAEQIFVSPHTVSFHLRKIYRKFGVRSRVELTRLLVEQEPPSDQLPALTPDPSIAPLRAGLAGDVDDARPADAVSGLGRDAIPIAVAGSRAMGDDAGTAPAHRSGRSPAVEQTGAGERPNFGWESLTAAELRVARLAATGLTNRSIADELELSPHTIESHLRHAFHKVDVRSRVELTRVVLAHGC